MEMKYVVPDMAQSFGTLEFAGESDHVFDRDKDNRRFFARRTGKPYLYKGWRQCESQGCGKIH